ncbi:hypothetical protein GCM10010965_14460 [Caldalkalibacillus thermarum]|uniref:hypothetical protein n=1 Tax=Caldalkalibacillus thermarum TaxID=296745 RepID=UPI00166A6B5D|nr:hypothetical protein [Caldalkalibacillus thermarum]GGK22671.1 hypothetical protein GCM10010965_14460 [Caldalkalibacillus thermarum]
MRKIQRFKSGRWLDTEPQQIKPGDIIRLFEPDGRPVRIPDWPKKGQSELKVREVIPLPNGNYRFVGEPA